MKAKIICLLLLYAFACNNTHACDVCGCATNANYFGILPQYGRHFFGVRYMNNDFTSKPLPSLFEVKSPAYRESLQRMEVYGRYYLADRLQLFAFAPYQYNMKNEGGAITENKGLSDLSVLCNYIVINTGDSGGRMWRNTLSMGGGIKVPTGRFNPSEAASQQTGSGTFDYLLNAIYTMRYKKTGVNLDANVRLNTTNQSYHYGNRFTSSARFFYWHKYKMISVLPHTGLLAEYAGKDRKDDHTQRYTGGNGYYSATGIDVYLRKISVGVVYTLPLYEKLNAGYAQTNYRLSVQALYLF